MATILKYPDFLLDPAFENVYTANIPLEWDGVSGIGGTWGNSSGAIYTKNLDDLVLASENFTATGTLVLTQTWATPITIVAGKVGIGAFDNSTGFSIYSTTKDTIDKIQFLMKDDLGTVTSDHTVNLPITTGQVIRFEWTYERANGFSTSRLIIRDPSNTTVLIDISSNIYAGYEVDSVGLWSLTQPNAGEDSIAVLTNFIWETNEPITNLCPEPQEIFDELGPVIERQSNLFNTSRRGSQIDRWISVECAKAHEAIDVTAAQLNVQVNATAEQIVARQTMFRDAVIFKVVARCLKKIGANRVEFTEPSTVPLTNEYNQEADRLLLHLMRLYHPESRGETVAVAALSNITTVQGGTLSLRPVDDAE